MSNVRSLIVNADDFGLSPGVNRGIIQAHERGIVTSASLMVRQPAAVPAAEDARRHPGLSVGLHVDICEWSCTDGNWHVLYEVVPVTSSSAIEQELAKQLDQFRSLMGRNPTHLDSHQHVHNDEPARSIFLREAARLGIPLRSFAQDVQYCGSFYGQGDKGYPFSEGISVNALVSLISGLRPGTTEMGCHPGDGTDLNSMYQRERPIEVEALCDPRVRAAIQREGIVLRSFSNYRGP